MLANCFSTEEATLAAREDGTSPAADLPPRLKTLCELMVFVKNLEITSTALLQSSAPRLGTRYTHLASTVLTN